MVGDIDIAQGFHTRLSLAGRGVIVLGAGQGIGWEAAHAAAALSARVACVDTDRDRADAVARSVGGVAHQGDITRAEDVERLMSEAEAALGRIDAVVDIVGMPRYAPILDSVDEDWEFCQSVSLRQAFYVLRAAGRRMATSGGGVIAFVSSVSSIAGAPRHAAYGAAKAGLNSLVRSAAHEFGPSGIRVNAIAPGLIWTPRVSGSVSDEGRDVAEQSIPLRRVGQPIDIAAGLMFLITDLSAYMTGQTLVLDGGASCGFPIDMSAVRR